MRAFLTHIHDSLASLIHSMVVILKKASRLLAFCSEWLAAHLHFRGKD